MQYIKKRKQASDSEGTSSQLAPRKSIRSPEHELILPPPNDTYSIKLSSFTGQELERNLRADQTLNMASQQKTDGMMIAALSENLLLKRYYRLPQ